MKHKLLSWGIFSAALCFCTVQAIIPLPKGNNYYVSVSGYDNNTGTLKAPFRSVQKGCDVLKPGDTLYIRAGEYHEKIEINSTGTEGEYITVQPYGNERVILNGEGNSKRSNIIHIKDKSYIRIKGLELRNSRDGDTPSGIMIEGFGRGIEILSNKIYSIESDSNSHGIAVYGRNSYIPIQGIKIEGNEIYNCRLGSSESLVVNGNVEDFRICGNIIHDNNNIGIDCIGFEKTAVLNDQPRSGLIAGNTVYNISSANNPVYEGDACAGGIYVDGGKDIIIERNRVYDCDIGIEVASEHYNKAAANILVRSNLIYSSHLYGLSLGGASGGNGYAENCHFICNTLYDNQIGINMQKSRYNKIISNIVYDTGTLLEGPLGSNILSCNVFYSPDGNPYKLPGFKDPKFKDPVHKDFELSKDSPAIDAGDPLYLCYGGEMDILNKPRVSNGRIDCGAFEYEEE
ncbi:MAG TPA: right-handed parallel beta-helix repeat-containing protein [Bacillota bacterium]|jgi:parallel beta-helix repeat protein|nr:right-handed parallel beta-helix repeat-containing protein [Bacillota bacterium]HRS20643.1 right-handed parallel beta-helix repeat-containing protein [Clostridia bacterium]HRU40361.1 right-handed parallel beta-helix repeat-containing protein [Candidatus Diapherotrites archaeon]HQI15782.1 right-handed parallel beta-helix repeat-containing protein [Bacillota bacterium]HQJ37416.1 right-handed parallel beta-helix repeat-containing protein [Bacillota bacterium]